MCINKKGFFEFFDCPGSRQGVEDLREVIGINKGSENKSKTCRGCKVSYVTGNCFAKLKVRQGLLQKAPGTFLNQGLSISLDGLISKECMEYLMKNVFLFEVELQGPQGDREVVVFQVSNDDTAVAQRRLEDKQHEEKTNTDCLRSTQQCMKSVVAKHLGVAGIQQQNGLDDETNVTLFTKVCCFLIQPGLSKVFWAEDTTREYKKTFIGSVVGAGSIYVLRGFEFEVEPLGNHTFEVEPQANVDQGVGLQEVQTQDLMDYQLARDREQH
nr:zinc finger, CCHC-type [Tanacetum cinerariifolium]